eukprot:COSAG04_NODE_466_length_13930_cov_50.807968_10_plen_163_part_00
MGRAQPSRRGLQSGGTCGPGDAGGSSETFPDGQLMTPAQQAILQGFLADRGLGTGVVWTLCFSSANGDAKNNPSTWHAQCDGHARTVVVGTNQHGFVFGGYAGAAWDAAWLRYIDMQTAAQRGRILWGARIGYSKCGAAWPLWCQVPLCERIRFGVIYYLHS